MLLESLSPQNKIVNLMCWRKRVGVEPTTRLAKSRINGFEGHEDHRTPFASAADYSSARGNCLFASAADSGEREVG